VVFLSHSADRLGRVVGTPASYSGGRGFKYRPANWLSRVRFLWFSLVIPPIVVVEWLALLLRFREVADSNFGPGNRLC
jgi:hypothetical protein